MQYRQLISPAAQVLVEQTIEALKELEAKKAEALKDK